MIRYDTILRYERFLARVNTRMSTPLMLTPPISKFSFRFTHSRTHTRTRQKNNTKKQKKQRKENLGAPSTTTPKWPFRERCPDPSRCPVKGPPRSAAVAAAVVVVAAVVGVAVPSAGEPRGVGSHVALQRWRSPWARALPRLPLPCRRVLSVPPRPDVPKGER